MVERERERERERGIFGVKKFKGHWIKIEMGVTQVK